MRVITCPACAGRCKLPPATIGKRAKCPHCGHPFVVPTETAPTEASSGDPLVSGLIKFRCAQCDARIKVPARAAQRKVKCPRCAAVLRVPRVAPGRAHPPAAGRPDAGLYELAAAEAAAPPVEQPATPATRRPAQGAGPTCPSCGKSLPPDAKICVDCGVSLKTGRSLLITQDENLDRIYAAAETTIRLVSWLVWIGLYPIASEAFGMKKPHVIRGLTVLTIVTSLAFLACLWSDAPAMDSLKNLMLWAGDPEVHPPALQAFPEMEQLPESLDEHDREELEQAWRKAREELTRAQAAWRGEFRPAQLLTYTFLHGGLLHLASNLLFLMVLGGRVNALIGNLWTGPVYLLLAVVAAGAHTIATAHDPLHPVVGASGAIMGLAGMYLVLFPAHKVHMVAWLRWIMFLFLFPLFVFVPFLLVLLLTRLSFKSFTLRGFWVVLFYIAFDVAYVVLGLEDEVARWAHLGGFLAGVAVASLLLVTRLINARGGDLFSVVLGRHAWALIGHPRA